MTQPQTLNVEYDELMARADELEAPIPAPPSDNPQAPSLLPMAIAAAQQLALSADNVRLYLSVGERERQRLAESLRDAAKEYEEVDDDAAAAVDSDGDPVSAATHGLQAKSLDEVVLTDTPIAEGYEDFPYRDVKETAQEISEPDQGVAFDSFADEWIAYQRTLVEATYRFRPFQYWDGDAAYAVEDSLDQQRSWLYEMADLCVVMATQARDAAAAQRWAVAEHPTVAELEQVDAEWVYYQDLYQRGDTYFWPLTKPQLLAQYEEYQQKSEEVLAEYEQQAALPLPPVNPPKPPAASGVAAVGDYGTDYYDDLFSDQGGPGSTGVPAVPAAGMAPMPATPDESTLTDAAAAALSTGSGLKPASFGGGGIGGGVPAVASPLQPPNFPEPAPPATSPSAFAGPGRGFPVTGAAMGAGGMGMGPMGGAPGAQGQAAGQAKRAQQSQESVYTERRPWTEGLIGLRRSKVAADLEAARRADELDDALTGPGRDR